MKLAVRELSPASLRAGGSCISSCGVNSDELHQFTTEVLSRLLLVEGTAGGWVEALCAEAMACGGRTCLAAAPARTDGCVKVLVALSDAALRQLCLQLSRQSADLANLSTDIAGLLTAVSASSGLWSFSGRTIALSARPCIMGVLNITPDSFSDGTRFFDLDRAVDRALEMVAEGADIIDIGGESTRPDAEPVPLGEELRRVVPLVAKLAEHVTVPLSVDTYKAAVARESLQAGAAIINDISGLTFDSAMASVVAAAEAGLVVMHTRGRPTEMQRDTAYGDLIGEVLDVLRSSLAIAEQAGIPAERIVVDPGIGFGKSVAGNLALLNRLDEFAALGRPILVGTSRKSFIGTVLKRNVDERLYGTAASVALGVAKGAAIFRVHDVKAMRDVADMAFAVSHQWA